MLKDKYVAFLYEWVLAQAMYPIVLIQHIVGCMYQVLHVCADQHVPQMHKITVSWILNCWRENKWCLKSSLHTVYPSYMTSVLYSINRKLKKIAISLCIGKSNVRACSHLASFLTRKSWQERFFSKIKSLQRFGYKLQPRAFFVAITTAATVA